LISPISVSNFCCSSSTTLSCCTNGSNCARIDTISSSASYTQNHNDPVITHFENTYLLSVNQTIDIHWHFFIQAPFKSLMLRLSLAYSLGLVGLVALHNPTWAILHKTFRNTQLTDSSAIWLE
jgi:hypothetical protein